MFRRPTTQVAIFKSRAIPSQVVEQLRSSGIVETIRVCEKLLPHRMKYRQFVTLFAFLLKTLPATGQKLQQGEVLSQGDRHLV